MRILYSCLSKSWGGMEMFTITACLQLMKRNLTVELICTKSSRIHIEADKLNIRNHPIDSTGLSIVSSIMEISSLVRKNKYNLVHTQASKDLWILVPALDLAGSKIPLYLTKQLNSYIIKKDILHRHLYNRVTKAFAISQKVKENLLYSCPLSEDKVLLLHNGIDVNRFNPKAIKGQSVREDFNIQIDKLVIGMMARFSPGKGHEEFIFTAKELSKKYNNLIFLIVGEASRGEDDYANEIRKSAEGFSNIIFAGYRADTPEVLASMDIFVFPSHAEALGIALIEAMAMGKPTVCSNAEGILDIAVDGETSLLFENRNENDLLKKLEILINDKNMRDVFSHNAIERIKKYFDIEILTDKVIEVYKQQ